MVLNISATSAKCVCVNAPLAVFICSSLVILLLISPVGAQERDVDPPTGIAVDPSPSVPPELRTHPETRPTGDRTSTVSSPHGGIPPRGGIADIPGKHPSWVIDHRRVPPDSVLIVRGSFAQVDEFPWMVSLVDTSNSRDVSAHFCGGSLIKERWVVTAAHCVDEGVAADQIMVIVGTIDLGNENLRHRVESIVIHSEWNKDSWDNDIALLRLADALPFEVIDVASSDETIKEATSTTIAGWGLTSEDGDPSAKLLKTNLEIVDRTRCNTALDNKVTENMFCAGFGDRVSDACTYDSGGPSMVHKSLGSYLLAGIISWGVGCARDGYYGVYTNVGRYSNWIVETTH